MKKIIAMLLVAVMALGMVACTSAGDNGESKNDTTPTTTGTQVEAPASALSVLENTWALYAEEQKFFAMGGYSVDADGVPTSVDGAPGAVEDTDYLTYSLLVPEEQQAGVTEAASLVHAMNANTFTAGAYKVADVESFAAAMQTAIQGNQWMCGFPEQLLIANVGGVVVVAFGHGDAMTPFQTNLTAAYTGVEILVSEAITG